MDLRQTLFDNRDLKYKDFHTKLVPNISPDRFIGVRVPVIRKIARQAFKENAYNPCEYYEEVMVKGISMILPNLYPLLIIGQFAIPALPHLSL